MNWTKPRRLSVAVLPLSLVLGCALPKLPAMPQPDELQICAEGPFDWEFCPTLKLRWFRAPLEPLRDSWEERERRRLRQQDFEERWRGKPHAARVLT